jgi:hypothetical protein
LREQVMSLSVQDAANSATIDKLAVLISGFGNALAADAEWQRHLNALIAEGVEAAFGLANEFGDDVTSIAIGSVQPSSIANEIESANATSDDPGARGMLIGAAVGCGTFLLSALIH